jgi:hypothetical protein
MNMTTPKIQMTAEGFYEQFEIQLKICKTMKEAYEAAERIHESLFQRRRYSEYKTFERVRNRKIKK